MAKLLNIYFHSAFSYHAINIVLAIFLPITLCFYLGYRWSEIRVELLFAIVMYILIEWSIGGYRSMKKGYQHYSQSK